MEKNLVKIYLKDKSGEITIVQKKPCTLWEIDLQEAMAWSEASVQLLEGSDYEYQITQGYTLDIDNSIFHPSLFNKYQGTIRTQNYIGTYPLPVHNSAGEPIDTVYIEIKSKKFNYRKEFRWMLRDIAEKCSELLLHSNANVLISLSPGNTIKAKTLYQRFAFIKSVLLSVEFKRAINKILCAPVTGWKTYTTVKDVGNVKISNRKLLRQIASNPGRQPLGNDHHLRDKLPSIPAKFTVENKTSTTDTIENQFIQFALTHFLTFLQDFVNQFKKKEGMLYEDACHLERQIDALLSHTFFKDLSTLRTIPFNNPVLQRKEGYREVFRTWLMFDMAANLAWKGGEEVFRAGRKDVPMLYEYWLFFQLLDAAKAVFIMSKHDIEDLIKKSDDQIGIILKRGDTFSINGVYHHPARNIQVKLCYNRAFNKQQHYPDPGSWSEELRPDFTLSLWPAGITEAVAEEEELIIHVHFDAKYKMKLDLHTYEKEDLKKMHVYRDAIRRTIGSYVLYPGDNDILYQPFHDTFPGIGAISVRPTEMNEGKCKLTKFMQDILHHYLNRTSDREKMAHRLYEIHKTGAPREHLTAFPESHGDHRSLLPESTYVLVSPYASEEHLHWILKNKLYNAQIENGKSIDLLRTRYLLLYSKQHKNATQLLLLDEQAPKIIPGKQLRKMGYHPVRGGNYFLLFNLLDNPHKELSNLKWDLNKLPINNGYPFAVSFADLSMTLF